MKYKVTRDLEVSLIAQGFSLGSEKRTVTFDVEVMYVTVQQDLSATAHAAISYDGTTVDVKPISFMYDPNSSNGLMKQADEAVTAGLPATNRAN